MFPAFLLRYFRDFTDFRNENSQIKIPLFSAGKQDDLPQSDIFGTIILFFSPTGEIKSDITVFFPAGLACIHFCFF
ncbi:MAG TPA: hypothetical protein DCG73_11140 [Morganella sp. (in: Bacteria)]|nr:hypothetical protein [Morganella sp. (in: enterobacteria)]